MSLVFQNFLRMVHDNTNGIWNGTSDSIYAAMILDGGTSAIDRSWTTMSQLLSNNWLRAAGATDQQILNGVRVVGTQTSASASFPAYSRVYKINGQVDFGTVTSGQSLRGIVVYWDSDGTPADDTTNLLLWIDDQNVNTAVTSTGANVWGAAGLNECVGISAADVAGYDAYVMLSGIVDMDDNANWWTTTRDFTLRLFQPSTGTSVSNPSSASTLTDLTSLGYQRAIAVGGGDVPDITISASQRSLIWSPSNKWDFYIDPGGSQLSFGNVQGGQSLAGVALADSITGRLWYWDGVFANTNISTDAPVTYGPSTQFLAFAHRSLTS